MRLINSHIEGVTLVETQSHFDDRGSFFEIFRSDVLGTELGVEFDLAQVNCSVSKKGVIRGIHSAKIPPGQAKFVMCIRGAIQDVVVDLRPNSETLSEWESFELSESNRRALYIPSGIGHAFQALEEDSLVVYLCDQKYNPNNEFAISPLDSDLGIDWNLKFEAILSEKDKAAQGFKSFLNNTKPEI